ncbi:MAG: SEC-C domain-containing protein [Holosporaceae bacterium]|nr:SEC-C domain-containing protein [Holosporaceae bacterium]
MKRKPAGVRRRRGLTEVGDYVDDKKESPAGEKRTSSTRVRKQSEEPNAPDIFSVGRNAPCPCGSGERFKNCCGKIK